MIKRNSKDLKILAVTPARGGSKGVPGKNINFLGNKPLIAYTISEAKKSKYIDRYLVVTEDKEIARAANKYGAEVFNQPPKFTTDLAAHEPGLIHVLKTLEEKEKFKADILVMLQATTPFRKVADIDAVIEKLVEQKEADSCVSVYPAPQHFNPKWISVLDEKGFLKPYEGGSYVLVRQKMPRVYWRDGQVYTVFTKALIESGSRYGKNGTIAYINTTDKYHINIDDEMDFWMAELLIEKRLENSL